MAVLSSLHTPIDTRRPRRTTLAASAIGHGSFIAILIVAAYNQGFVLRPHEARALTFVAIAPLPVPPPVTPPRPLRLPPIVKEEIKPPRVAVAAPPVPEERPDPPVPVPVRREEPVPAEKPKLAPVVMVGAFALNGNSAHAPEMARPVQSAGFDAPEAHAVQLTAATTSVGGFEQASAGQPRPGTDRPNVFGDSGFGSGVATGRARPMAQVTEGGFGNIAPGTARRGGGGQTVAAGGFDAAPAAATAASPSEAVKSADFDARPTAAPPRVTQQTVTDVPLEVLSKPTPVYSEDARSLRIEGEVLLEVEFTATGEIHVMRIVRGLGHGLDESAARAVQAMRFKPALRNGQPVDVRTMVTIVFRLA